MKRFSFAGPWRDKITNSVDFPLTELNLDRYCAPQSNTNVSMIYDLYAVTNHFGSLEGGHYTSYCRDAHRQQWYHFDDTKITAVDEQSVRSKNAYILFYIRRDSNLHSAAFHPLSVLG